MSGQVMPGVFKTAHDKPTVLYILLCYEQLMAATFHSQWEGA
jgi:hypothetical protein